MKKLLASVTLLILLPVFGIAEPQYVTFNYDIKADGGALSDMQCQQLLQAPLYYDIVNDKAIYLPTKYYKIIAYTRRRVTYLNNKLTLFTGSYQYMINFPGVKTHSTKAYLQFLLDSNQKLVRGSLVIPNLCMANFIGVEQNLTQWTHAKQ